ncbi:MULTISPECIES: DNA helicase PcrA [Crocosphaera]|uniref:ATP-dependent DNA helicase n=4 Tax=Crocosphaera watsonii TaxID=263511 RepID=T2JS72_CROWT|nr:MULTISPECIES: DNA helicase PcrA [Crocosphaera]MCH2246319.1 DNA helicase PcrA [Crocosphaera sp.]NQZ62981.1 DNA helicase PcrA [Crocosphaera sp.]CCQ55830.1 ATP-dependent DNA helicase UvrD/PcrA [Crocosphaera watsonii WH 0005]CCQ67432.1 ATP-dependent DNA helicase UvrD/PcrA [Crocosphaera watsonii WH 0402]
MTASVNFLSQLNPSQRIAVEHFCGPLLVVAGAGSGKTRALTYRIAHLITHYQVDPESILAVTFTNKAAREMKDRLERLFAQEMALKQQGQPFNSLPEYDQKRLLSQVYKKTTKKLWIGTFHSLCARILRYDINKYQDEKKRQWERNFSIFDESDVQSLVKNIVLKQFNLDDKKFNPRTVRYAISNAKNLGLSPEAYLKENSYAKGRVIAEVYNEYQTQLAANNALDFDDLILVPVRLFQQNESILGYWHSQFKHILVDEYQDTNRIQYELIQLLTTNAEPRKSEWNWENRSIFVVGDADQSIYSFRMADFTILLNFQSDFGDGLPDEDTRTMVKLEENYRSTETILQAANQLIENNSQRIDKILRPTRGEGEEIYCYKAEDERIEADFVMGKIQEMVETNPELNWGDFALLYRVNAQSRPFEDNFIRNNIPYNIVGGFKFYDRQEIKDSIAYLRLIVNPFDTVSLLRVINSPRRGIGKTSIDSLLKASQELEIPLWEIVRDETSVKTLAGRAAKSVNKFASMIKELQGKLKELSGTEIFDQIMELSGYVDDLKKKGTEEADNRLENIYELYSAIAQYQEENEDTSLQGYLTNASLASDLDNLDEGQEKVSLMTLHSAKGLEFPIVFLVGLEQGTFPHVRSLNDPLSLEEERRLCYVGITRAQEQLFISHARERYVWGSKEMKMVSQFIQEIPEELINSNLRPTARKVHRKKTVSSSANAKWSVGDRVIHHSFGEGEITHILGSGKKTNLAIQFAGLGRKIVDPRTNSITKIE